MLRFVINLLVFYYHKIYLLPFYQKGIVYTLSFYYNGYNNFSSVSITGYSQYTAGHCPVPLCHCRRWL